MVSFRSHRTGCKEIFSQISKPQYNSLWTPEEGCEEMQGERGLKQPVLGEAGWGAKYSE